MTLPRFPRCVITGAGSGFGRALAIDLASRGAHLVLSDRDVEGVEETARLARGAGAGRNLPSGVFSNPSCVPNTPISSSALS